MLIFEHFLYHYTRTSVKMFQNFQKVKVFSSTKNHFTWARFLYMLYKTGTNFYIIVLIGLKQNA